MRAFVFVYAVGLHRFNVYILCLFQVSFLTLRNGDQQGIHHQPSGVKVAPGYMPSCMSARQRRPIAQTLSGFDIAIVMLAQMVNLQSGITVISLPQASDIPTPGTGVFIVGYGRDDNDRDPSRKNGGILKKGELVVHKQHDSVSQFVSSQSVILCVCVSVCLSVCLPDPVVVLVRALIITTVFG